MTDRLIQPGEFYTTSAKERETVVRSAPAWVWDVIDDAVRFAIDNAPDITDTDYKTAAFVMEQQTQQGAPLTIELFQSRPAWKNVPFSEEGRPLPWVTAYECDDGHASERWTKNTEHEGESDHCPHCGNEVEGTYCGASTSVWNGPESPFEIMLWTRLVA